MKHLSKIVVVLFVLALTVLAMKPAGAFESGDTVDGYVKMKYTGEMAGWVYQQSTAESQQTYPRLADVCGDAQQIYHAQIVHYESGAVVGNKFPWNIGDNFFALLPRSGHYFLRWQCVDAGAWFSSIDATAAPRANWYFAWPAPPSNIIVK